MGQGRREGEKEREEDGRVRDEGKDYKKKL